jgi:protein involved in polysaccharide export with SLBB domain
MTKVFVFVGVLLVALCLGDSARGEKSTPKATVSMGKEGPTFAGKDVKDEAELTEGGVFLRTKKLKSGGMSLLLKSQGEPREVEVFGRKVKLGKNGQYQVKWDSEAGKISTAEADAEVGKWVAPPDLYRWFSGSEGVAAAKEEVIRLPRKIVFKPGEGVKELENPVRGVAGVDGELSDEGDDDYLPPLRDVNGKLTKIEGSGGGFEGGFYPEEESPRGGAETEVVPIGKSVKGEDGEYVVQPGDTIDLSFYRVQRVTVDMRGDIRVVSSIGSAESVIRAAGRTPKEISDSVINSGLNFRSVTEPALKVNVSRFADKSVVVLGRVGKPGKIPLEDGEILTAAGVIKRAGGFAGGRDGAVVYIKRGDKISKADLDSGDEDSLELFRIMPGDIVTVNKE